MMNKLVSLLETTGMVESTSRCEIIAGELIANGVTIQHYGEWVEHRKHHLHSPRKGYIAKVTCSLCGANTYMIKTKYCRNCGAEMKGVKVEYDD